MRWVCAEHNIMVKSCVLSTDTLGMLGRGSGLQPGVMLSPGMLPEAKAKILHTNFTSMPWRDATETLPPWDSSLTTGRHLPTWSNLHFRRQHGLDSWMCWLKSELAQPQPTETKTAFQKTQQQTIQPRTRSETRTPHPSASPAQTPHQPLAQERTD